jgi:putative membrane protein
MIDYDAKGWLGIIFRWRGSVFPQLVPRIVVVTMMGAVAAWLEERKNFSIAPIAHTLIGVALGLLLVFRTNASYDRFWEGRKLLGGIVNRSRDLARQAAAWLGDAPTLREDFRRLLVAMVALIHQRLRKETDLSALGALLSEKERQQLEPLAARALTVATWLSFRLAERAREGKLSEQRLQSMDANLTALIDSMGGAERIVKTPVPFAYAQHIKIFVSLFCFTVPFAMSSSLHWLTPGGAALLGFALFGIDEIGVEIEEPFGYDPNDLPLDAILQGIDRDATEILGASKRPPSPTA